MGKLGKIQNMELTEVNKQKSGGYFNDENSKNGTSNFDNHEYEVHKDEVGKREISSKNQRASIGAAKLITKENVTKNETDDVTLNGSKASCSSAPPHKKKKEIPKCHVSEKQHKQYKAKELDEDNTEEAVFEVEAIVGHKTRRGESSFLVHWKGYGMEEDSWEPEADLNCDDLIEEYRRKERAKKDNGVLKKAAACDKDGRRRKPNKNIASAPEKEWAVERILDFVDDGRGGLYRIRWKGFGAKEDTWEPESNLSCEGLIEKFKKNKEAHRNVDIKNLRESPKKTKRLVNETTPRSTFHSRIERSSKRAAAKNRVFYGEE